MGVVKTDLRFTREKAKKIRFYPITGIPATNVQDAIAETYAAAGTTPPAIVPKTITNAMSPYTILPTDYLLEVDVTGGAVVLNTGAQAARGGRPVIIEHVKGDAVANNITINRNGAELIAGATAYLIDYNFGRVELRPSANMPGYSVG